MKKITLDQTLKTSKIFWKKIAQRLIYLKANIPAGKAAKVPPFGSLLGTTGVNADLLCETFNKLTLPIYLTDIILPVLITITPTKQFLLQIKQPTIYTMINLIFMSITKLKFFIKNLTYKYMLLIIAYKLVLMKSNSKKKEILKGLLRSIRGSCKSYDLHDIGKKAAQKKTYYKKKK